MLISTQKQKNKTLENVDFTKVSSLLSWKDLNLRMQESKSCALPLGDSPKCITAMIIHYFFRMCKFFLQRIFDV